MSYVKKFPNSDAFFNRPVEVSGIGAPPAAAAAPTIGQGTSNQSNPTASGRFTNLQNYLSANKDYNKPSGGLAGQMNTNFKNQTTGIQNDINTAKTQFDNKAAAGSVVANPDLLAQAFSDPNAFVQNAANVDAFTKQRDATYSGPTALDASAAAAKTTNLQDNTNLTNSENGRYALLSKMFGRPDYNSGAQKLDNLLLQGNEQQLGKLQSSRALPSQLGSDIAAKTTQASLAAQQNARNAQQLSTNTRAGLSGEILNRDQKAKTLSEKYNTAQKAEQDGARYNFNRNVMTEADRAKYNIPKDLRFSNNINLSNPNYFSNTAFSTPQSVMTEQEYAQMAALNKLSNTGGTVSSDAATALSNYGNPELAGTYNGLETPYNFDGSKFLKDVSDEKSAYDGRLNEIYKTVTPHYTPGKNPKETLAAIQYLDDMFQGRLGYGGAENGVVQDNRSAHKYNDVNYADYSGGHPVDPRLLTGGQNQTMKDLIALIQQYQLTDDGSMPNSINGIGDASIPAQDITGTIRTGIRPNYTPTVY